MTEFRIALTTCQRDSSDRIAEEFVEKRLCACVSIVRGLSSVYRWKGEIEKEPEDLLIIKTTAVKIASLEQALLASHPYEVPEFIVLPIIEGNDTYLDWITQSVNSESSEK